MEMKSWSGRGRSYHRCCLPQLSVYSYGHSGVGTKGDDGGFYGTRDGLLGFSFCGGFIVTSPTHSESYFAMQISNAFALHL